MSTAEYYKTVEIETTSQSFNDVLARLDEYMWHETGEGYSGMLFLDMASITTGPAGTRSQSFTQTETRIFANLSNPDVSLIPHAITVGGNELTLAGVTWAGGSEETVDYTRIANTFTATATYSRTGVRSITMGYVTTAGFAGQLTRITEGETTYTALFIGEEISGAGYGEDGYGYGEDGYDDGTGGAGTAGAADGTGGANGDSSPDRAPISLNWPLILSALAAIAAIASAAWFFFIRGNVQVFNMQEDGSYSKVGRVKVGKGNKYIADLSAFTDKAKTSAFRLDFSGFAAARLKGQTLTANYGSQTLAHTVNYEKGQKKYQWHVDF